MTIYTATAAGAGHDPLQRFQTLLRLLTGPGTRPSVLDLQPTHVSDSGVFSCASPSQAGPNVSVTITPGSWPGLKVLAGCCVLTFLFFSTSVGAVCYVHRKPLGPQVPVSSQTRICYECAQELTRLVR